jgi:hypothetical protein
MRSVNSRLIERILGVLASGLVAGASCGGQSVSDSPSSGTGGTTNDPATGGGTNPTGGRQVQPPNTGGVPSPPGTGGVPSPPGTGGVPNPPSTGGAPSGGMSNASGGLPANCQGNPVGVCCTNEMCVAPDKVAEAFPAAMLGSGGDSGGSGGSAGASEQAGAAGEGSVAPLSCPVFEANWLCGWIHDPPTEKDGLCCYAVTSGTCCGRPFLVEGESRVAPVRRGKGWSGDARAIDPTALEARTRAALAEGWLEDARLEHASVAAFARFVLQLLSLGAPRSLVERAQAAIGDEIRHAAICFELASRYAGVELEPGPLPLDGVLAGDDLAGIAALVVREGCVGETVAAAIAAEQAHLASDPTLAALLDSIAEDETRHAELAWAFVQWAVATGGVPVRAAVERAFETAARCSTTCTGASNDDPLATHGRLGHDARTALALQIQRTVIEPCGRALLA